MVAHWCRRRRASTCSTIRDVSTAHRVPALPDIAYQRVAPYAMSVPDIAYQPVALYTMSVLHIAYQRSTIR
eukprot:2168635-Rhodomonas_salina.1